MSKRRHASGVVPLASCQRRHPGACLTMMMFITMMARGNAASCWDKNGVAVFCQGMIINLPRARQPEREFVTERRLRKTKNRLRHDAGYQSHGECWPGGMPLMLLLLHGFSGSPRLYRDRRRPFSHGPCKHSAGLTPRYTMPILSCRLRSNQMQPAIPARMLWL